MDEFLKEEGIFEEVQAQAFKEVVAWQLAEAMKQRGISKNKMALKTGWTQVDTLASTKLVPAFDLLKVTWTHRYWVEWQSTGSRWNSSLRSAVCSWSKATTGGAVRRIAA